jgi:uncharacterized protein
VTSVRVERRTRVDDELLDQLGVASTRFYRAELDRIQLAQAGHGTTTYLVAYDDGRPAGLAPVYTASPPWHPDTDPDALFPSAGPAKLCLAGSYGLHANYLTVSGSGPGGLAGLVAQTLVDEACTVARADDCRYVMLPYLDRTQAGWLDTCRDAASVAIHEKAVLPVEWRDFDEYVSWLPHRRRASVRQERRRFRDCGVDVRERSMADVAGEVAPLLAATEQRHGRTADAQQIEFHYSLLGMELGDDFVALVGYLDGRPVACSVLLTCGDRWIVKAWGCDYSALVDAFVYFNLLFYEPVCRAGERGIAVLDYGLGGLDSKTRRGCTLEPLHTMLIDA